MGSVSRTTGSSLSETGQNLQTRKFLEQSKVFSLGGRVVEALEQSH